MAEQAKKWAGAKVPAEVKPVAEVKANPKPDGYQEYPKLVYRATDTLRVNNPQEERDAANSGYGPAK